MTSHCTRCLRPIPAEEMDVYLKANDHLGDCCADVTDSEHAARVVASERRKTAEVGG